jgi:hypothetical protein
VPLSPDGESIDFGENNVKAFSLNNVVSPIGEKAISGEKGQKERMGDWAFYPLSPRQSSTKRGDPPRSATSTSTA